MKCLIAAIRRDLRAPQLPFVAVQIGRVCGPGQDSTSWNSIQDQQRRMPGKIRNVAAVPAIDLELDDGIHISGRGQQRLGARLAQAMCALRGGARGERLPIELESVVPQADPLTGSANLLVRFRNVAGRLQAPDRPSGFEIVVGDQPTGSIYRTDLRGTSVLLKTGLPPWDLNTASLSYGHGTVPYCNIADSAGRSLPALGPVPCTTKQTPATPWVNRLMVSQAMPPVRDIRSLAYPKNKRPLGLAMRTFPGVFCDLHMDLFACAPADALVYFLSRFRCAEDMRLAVCVGYDGPVKLWVDRKPRFADPNGTNPATPDRATVPVRLKRGDHEILIGLSSNCGRAWGVFLRLMRKDLTRRQARAGSGAYRMPEWLAPS
jgi:sialate O-acetylesterase